MPCQETTSHQQQISLCNNAVLVFFAPQFIFPAFHRQNESVKASLQFAMHGAKVFPSIHVGICKTCMYKSCAVTIEDPNLQAIAAQQYTLQHFSQTREAKK